MSLTDDAIAGQDARDVEEAHYNDQADEYGEANDVYQTLALRRDSSASASPLYEDEHQPSAVERGDRKNVNQTQTDADDGH